MYPQAEFPYDRLVDENRRRGRDDPEYELLDTGVFDDGRYWEITADYAKAAPEDLLIRITVRNAGPDTATLHVLPTLWFRNTWSWEAQAAQPQISPVDGALVADHAELGRRWLSSADSPAALFCDNETNARALFGPDARQATPYPKDGINDHVTQGADTVNPGRRGTKAALHHRLTVPPGGSATIQLRLRDSDPGAAGVGDDFAEVMAAREREADDFYAELTPASASADEALVLRQAFAGMLWSKQFFHFDVRRWLEGDPAYPPPPAERLSGRNHEWTHLNNRDVISMPDKWEYPWYAAWDLAFHCVALAHVDPEFAKSQLILLCREWYVHPNGQLPAYEWNFSDVNPPVQAWAALRVYEIAGDDDFDFLARVLHKLLLNFTWWVNRKDVEGDNLFEGGFLGLDNIGPFDRSKLPVDGVLEQSDGTAWMAMYCQNLLEMALALSSHDSVYEDLATKFFEHFALIASALNDKGLWNEQDGFYYDVLRTGGDAIPLRARSMVGLLPLAAVTTIGPETMAAPAGLRRPRGVVRGEPAAGQGRPAHGVPGARGLADALDRRRGPAAAAARRDARPRRVPLRPRPARALAPPPPPAADDRGRRRHRHARLRARRVAHRPVRRQLQLARAGVVPDQLPAHRDAARLPPLPGRRLHRRVPHRRRRASSRWPRSPTSWPTGSSPSSARGPTAGARSSAPTAFRPDDPAWHDLIPFHEYFHGDTGAGLGASHQTGWTGLVANLIIGRRRT